MCAAVVVRCTGARRLRVLQRARVEGGAVRVHRVGGVRCRDRLRPRGDPRAARRVPHGPSGEEPPQRPPRFCRLFAASVFFSPPRYC